MIILFDLRVLNVEPYLLLILFNNELIPLVVHRLHSLGNRLKLEFHLDCHRKSDQLAQHVPCQCWHSTLECLLPPRHQQRRYPGRFYNLHQLWRPHLP